MITRERFQVVLFLLAFVGLLYAHSVYNGFFERRDGFVYHPETGRAYAIRFERWVSPYDKWAPLIPFRPFEYGDVAEVEYLGQLSALLRQAKRRNAYLQEELPRSSSRHVELNPVAFDADNDTVTWWDMHLSRRHDVEVTALIPRALFELKRIAADQSSDVFVADAVVAADTVRVSESSVDRDEAADIEVLRRALVVRGRALQVLRDTGIR